MILTNEKATECILILIACVKFSEIKMRSISTTSLFTFWRIVFYHYLSPRNFITLNFQHHEKNIFNRFSFFYFLNYTSAIRMATALWMPLIRPWWTTMLHNSFTDITLPTATATAQRTFLICPSLII